MGPPAKRAGSVALLLGLVLLLTGAILVTGIAFRSPCPECLGEGLVREPRGETPGTRWVTPDDLVPVPCDTCADRLKVSLLRKWMSRPELAPKPPVYRAKQLEPFAPRRRERMTIIGADATRGTGGHPPTGTSGRPDLLPILGAALNDEDRQVRTQAASALANMNHEEALPLLLGAMKHPDDLVKSYACEGLGWLGRLEPLRASAVAALATLCDSAEGIPFDVRFAAASSLLELGELRSADIFVEALKGSHANSTIVRRAIVQFDRKDAILLIITQLAKLPPDDAYRDKADAYREVLERLTGEKLGDDPVKWYRWLEKNRAHLPEQVQ